MPVTDSDYIPRSKCLVEFLELLVVLGAIPETEAIKEHLLGLFVMPMQGCILMTAPLLRTLLLNMLEIEMQPT